VDLAPSCGVGKTALLLFREKTHKNPR
jgi:hypothetical protein